MDARQKWGEEHTRKAESALLYADVAARKIGRVADELEQDAADPHLVAALRVASDAVREDHRQLKESVYFGAPGDEAKQDLLGGGQPERLAS